MQSNREPSSLFLLLLMKDLIEKTVVELIEGEPYYIVEVTEKNDHIRIIMDGYNGIDINRCQRLARKLHNLSEEEGWGLENYHLEISSFGVNKALTDLRQYKSNVGRKAHARQTDMKEFKGRLIATTPSEIMIKTDSDKVRIPLEKIDRLKIEVEI